MTNSVIRVAPARGGLAYLALALLAILATAVTFTDARADEKAADLPWSLQFQIRDSFQLSNFDGLGVSLGRSLGEQSMLRLGVTVGAFSGDDDVANAFADSTETQARNEDNSYSLSVSAVLIRKASGLRRAFAYWGIGPFATMSTQDNDRFVTQENGQRFVEERDRNLRSLGLRAVLGVEVRILPELSLHGEYGLDASRTTDRVESASFVDGESTQLQTVDDTEYSLRQRNLLFGVSLFF